MGDHITSVDQVIIDFYMANPNWEMVIKLGVSLFALYIIAIILHKEVVKATRDSSYTKDK